MRNYDSEKELNSNKEFSLMESIVPHPCIVKPLEFIATQRWTYTIMELAKGLELQEFVSQNPSLPISSIKTVMRQILESIKHLH